MKITMISNLYTLPQNNNYGANVGTKARAEYTQFDNFGLKLQSPLNVDTVSFGCKKLPTKKIMATRKDAVSNHLAMLVKKQVTPSHNSLKKFFIESFADILSDTNEKMLITLKDRVKSENSICEKSATRGWKNKKDIMEQMEDISGFCFILEDKKSHTEFVKRFSDLIKDRKIDVKEMEYHRIAPLIKNNKILKTYDSLRISGIQKLKDTVSNTYHPTKKFNYDVDSVSGYSGLHIIVDNHDGTKSEIQVMTRAMYDLKNVENLYFKVRNGKNIDTKFKYIESILLPLKKVPDEFATEKDKLLQKAISKYTLEAYKEVLSHPYSAKKHFLKPSDVYNKKSKEYELIKDYDFNKISVLVDACDQISSKIS